MLVTSPETSEDPTGEPSPVTVLAPADEALPLDVVVDAGLTPRPLECEENGKPPKLHEPPDEPSRPG